MKNFMNGHLMIKFLLNTVLFFSLSCSLIANDKLTQIDNSVLRIGIFDNKGLASAGTSFCVSENVFVTNYHVVQLAVENPDKYKLMALAEYTDKIILKEANVLHYAPNKDLAIIKVEGVSRKPVVFSRNADIEQSQDVYAIGFPVSSDNALNANIIQPTSTKGIISKLDAFSLIPNSQNTRMIITDATMNPGNSGGPLINKCGHVVGINESKISGNIKILAHIDNVYYAVHANELIDLLDANNLKYKIASDSCDELIENIEILGFNSSTSNIIIISFILLVILIAVIFWILKLQSNTKVGKEDLSILVQEKMKKHTQPHQPINVPQTKRITLIPNGLNPNIVLEQNIKKTLGRSPDNSIVVNNEYISKHHLTVLFDGAYVYIEDLNSTNGSYFDGEKLTPGKSMRFPDGKRLLVGSRDVIYTLGPIS